MLNNIFDKYFIFESNRANVLLLWNMINFGNLMFVLNVIVILN